MGECQSTACCYTNESRFKMFENSSKFLELAKAKHKNFNQADKTSTLVFDNDATYTGTLKNGTIRDGYGIQKWPDGATYEGEWKDDVAQGKGKLIHPDGDIYYGEWKNDKANGYGVYHHANGTKYIGEWMDDKQHGKGVEKWSDGTCYEGEYKDGLKHGKGIFRFADGSFYEGEFKYNFIDGSFSYLTVIFRIWQI